MSAGDNFIIKLAYDFYGNYTLQDLIEAASRLRSAAAALLKAKQLTKAQANSASGVVNGQDYLGKATPANDQHFLLPTLKALKPLLSMISKIVMCRSALAYKNLF